MSRVVTLRSVSLVIKHFLPLWGDRKPRGAGKSGMPFPQMEYGFDKARPVQSRVAVDNRTGAS